MEERWAIDEIGRNAVHTPHAAFTEFIDSPAVLKVRVDGVRFNIPSSRATAERDRRTARRSGVAMMPRTESASWRCLRRRCEESRLGLCLLMACGLT